MDESKVQQTENIFKDSHTTADASAGQRGLTFPPLKRGSDNDEKHEEEGFQAFVLGYN